MCIKIHASDTELKFLNGFTEYTIVRKNNHNYRVYVNHKFPNR